MNPLQAVRNELCSHGNICKTCGYKVRGVNHATGTHHATKKAQRTRGDIPRVCTGEHPVPLAHADGTIPAKPVRAEAQLDALVNLIRKT